MSQVKLLNILWVLLLVLTVGGAWLGESSGPGTGVALFVIITMALKGRLIIDHFMELNSANVTIRRLMRAYFYVLPLCVLLTYFFGDWLAGLTTL
ncbi:MAG: cytochrome C oxidase subunit IV family protein [Candidatus Sedimenticola sp. PURPLELP]